MNHNEWLDAARIAREPQVPEVVTADAEKEEDEYAGQDMVEVIMAKGGSKRRTLRTTAHNWLAAGHITEIIEPKIQ